MGEKKVVETSLKGIPLSRRSRGDGKGRIRDFGGGGTFFQGFKSTREVRGREREAAWTTPRGENGKGEELDQRAPIFLP